MMDSDIGRAVYAKFAKAPGSAFRAALGRKSPEVRGVIAKALRMVRAKSGGDARYIRQSIATFACDGI